MPYGDDRRSEQRRAERKGHEMTTPPTYRQIVLRANHVCDLALDGSMKLGTVTRATAAEATQLAAAAQRAALAGDVEHAVELLDEATFLVD